MHLILFDIDGTLIRGEGMGSLAVKRALEECFGVSAVDNPALQGVPFNGRTDPAILADFARILGVSEALRERWAAFQQCYLRHLRITVRESDRKRVLAGVRDVLPRLHRDARAALGLLTGNLEAGARVKLEAFDLNHFFPVGGFGDDGPDRAVLAARARERGEQHYRCGFAPERVVVVGDTVHDVAAARAHGFVAVGVETGGQAGAALREAGAHAVFPDLAQGFGRWLEQRLG